jgi:hypothetical protein
MHTTAIYIGAGTDTKPLQIFKHIHEFIYVDCQPRSESTEIFPGCERPEFPQQAHNAVTKIGYSLTKNANDVYEFVHIQNGTILKYFMNCPFPYGLSPALVHEIKKASVLIVCGHTPSHIILDMMKAGPKQFIGNNITCYSGEEEEYIAVDKILLENPSIMSVYMRFDIPYESPAEEQIDSKLFTVTKYKSLAELYKSRP